MKATGKSAAGNLQKPITNIQDVVAEDEDKLAWVSFGFRSAVAEVL